jgi:hypothetical protein
MIIKKYILSKIDYIGEILAQNKLYYIRGITYVSIINTVAIMILTLSTKSINTILTNTGISLSIIYFVAAIIMIILPAIAGFIDWNIICKHENNLSIKQTPIWMNMKDEIKSLNDEVKNLNAKIDKLLVEMENNKK